MNNSICKAIKNRQLIQFKYSDKNRIIEPYCYGLSNKRNEVLRGFQIQGGSASGEIVGWKRLCCINLFRNGFWCGEPSFRPP